MRANWGGAGPPAPLPIYAILQLSCKGFFAQAHVFFSFQRIFLLFCFRSRRLLRVELERSFDDQLCQKYAYHKLLKSALCCQKIQLSILLWHVFALIHNPSAVLKFPIQRGILRHFVVWSDCALSCAGYVFIRTGTVQSARSFVSALSTRPLGHLASCAYLLHWTALRQRAVLLRFIASLLYIVLPCPTSCTTNSQHPVQLVVLVVVCPTSPQQIEVVEFGLKRASSCRLAVESLPSDYHLSPAACMLQMKFPCWRIRTEIAFATHRALFLHIAENN